MTDRELLTAYRKNPSAENRAALLKHVSPVISAGLKTWGGGNPVLDMRAKIIAWDAIKKYDPVKSQASLKTWVSSNMPKLGRYRDMRTTVIRVPDTVKRDVRDIQRLKEEYYERHGNLPPVGWIKDRAGLSEKRLRKALGAYSETGEGGLAVGEAFEVRGPQEDSGFKLWVDAVYAGLDDRGKKIFEGVSGYMGAPKKAKNEIAKELGISPPAISGRIESIKKTLQEYHTL